MVIGGEGSLKGALSLHRRDFPVVGVPASIDNDVGGTDIAIGVDTAINTALDASISSRIRRRRSIAPSSWK